MQAAALVMLGFAHPRALAKKDGGARAPLSRGRDFWLTRNYRRLRRRETRRPTLYILTLFAWCCYRRFSRAALLSFFFSFLLPSRTRKETMEAGMRATKQMLLGAAARWQSTSLKTGARRVQQFHCAARRTQCSNTLVVKRGAIAGALANCTRPFSATAISRHGHIDPPKPGEECVSIPSHAHAAPNVSYTD